MLRIKIIISCGCVSYSKLRYVVGRYDSDNYLFVKIGLEECPLVKTDVLKHLISQFPILISIILNK